MSKLLTTIQSQMTDAVKSHDRRRVDTLRYLLAEIRNIAIAKYANKAEAAITDEDVLDVIKKQVKTHRESIEAFTNAGRSELARGEQTQLAILESYLPKQMTDEEIKKILEPIVATGERNFGMLMGGAMKAVAGRAEGLRVSKMLKQLLNTPEV